MQIITWLKRKSRGVRRRWKTWQLENQLEKNYKYRESDAYLLSQYLDYTQTVSTPVMAISWETVRLLSSLLQTKMFLQCIDFGSGFTSFLLRYWNQKLNSSWNIISVDDNAHWLDKTCIYLRSQNISSDGLYTTSEFFKIPSKTYDLIIYDYSSFQERANFLSSLTHFVKTQTVILFDDYHLRSDTILYNQAVYDWCDQNNFDLLSLHRTTRDTYNRFSAIGFSTQSSTFKQLLNHL